MSEVQQHLAPLKQQSSALEGEAARHAEELNSTKLMLRDATAAAWQAQKVCFPVLSTVSKSMQSTDPQ